MQYIEFARSVFTINSTLYHYNVTRKGLSTIYRFSVINEFSVFVDNYVEFTKLRNNAIYRSFFLEKMKQSLYFNHISDFSREIRIGNFNLILRNTIQELMKISDLLLDHPPHSMVGFNKFKYKLLCQRRYVTFALVSQTLSLIKNFRR